MSIYVPSRLSWSAVSSYAECGERFRLERMYRVPKHTWFATIAGKAIHEITEFIDRAVFGGLDLDDAAGMAPAFQAVFDRYLADPKEVPELGVKPSAARRPQKTITENGGPNGKDYGWWVHWGPLFIDRYVRWRKASPWSIAQLPDGRPGIELEFNIEIASKRSQGFIDRILHDPATDSLILLDIKTGKKPDGALQLISYAMACEVVYGLEVPYAGFWLPIASGYKGSEDEHKGLLTPLTDVGNYSMERLTAMYENALRGIKAGAFVPQVTSMCSGCTVRDYCWAVAGKRAKEIPVSEDIVERSIGEVVHEAANV